MHKQEELQLIHCIQLEHT